MSYSRNPNIDLVWDSGTGQYVPAAVTVTITINPTPSDATVVLTSTGATQSGNTITVEENASVTYTVSKTGYTAVTDTITATATTTINVTLTAIPVIQEISISGTVYDINGKAVVNQNTAVGADEKAYIWIGSAQEYNDQNIATNHPEWLSFVKATNGLRIYTKEEVDALIASKFQTVSSLPASPDANTYYFVTGS